MAEAAHAPEVDSGLPPRPDISHLIMEDDEPLDNWFQERLMRLLPESLYTSWADTQPERPFLVAANVGLFYKLSEQAVVPDVMLSLDVSVPQEWWKDHQRSYLTWEFGKPPELVIEIVSNRKGGEEDKFRRYSQAGVAYYAIYDPQKYLSKRPLRLFVLHAGKYVEVMDPGWMEELGLGLTLWTGEYEGMSATWLRWCDRQGNFLPTGHEKAQQEFDRAEQEHERAEQEHARAEQERARAEQERARAERLAARLRELGLDEI
jgi:Uma2 family endonuclease